MSLPVGSGAGVLTLKYSRPQCSPPRAATLSGARLMKRPPFTAGSILKACVPLWATPSSTAMSPVLVKPAGMLPAGVDSKSSDTMVPGTEWPAMLAQPDTAILSTAAANNIFMENPQSLLNDDPIGSL